MSHHDRWATGAAATLLVYVALTKPDRNSRRGLFGVTVGVPFGPIVRQIEGHGEPSCSLLAVRKQRAREEVCKDKIWPLEAWPAATPSEPRLGSG